MGLLQIFPNLEYCGNGDKENKLPHIKFKTGSSTCLLYTSYVNKVINQMEKDKFIDCETILSDVHQGYNAGLSRAIEIVKAGGL